MVNLLLRKGASSGVLRQILGQSDLFSVVRKSKRMDLDWASQNPNEAPQDLVARWQSVEHMIKHNAISSGREIRAASKHRRFWSFTKTFKRR